MRHVTHRGRARLVRAVAMTLITVHTVALRADDWPMLGRDAQRSSLSLNRNPPVDWDIGTGKNIRWKARLGWIAFADPGVAGGLVWVGSNLWRPGHTSTTNEVATQLGFRERNGLPVPQNTTKSNYEYAKAQ